MTENNKAQCLILAGRSFQYDCDDVHKVMINEDDVILCR